MDRAMARGGRSTVFATLVRSVARLRPLLDGPRMTAPSKLLPCGVCQDPDRPAAQTAHPKRMWSLR
jgi:hypothetical protein